MCLAGVLEDTSWHRRGGERKPRATAACGRGVCDHPERERGHWCLAGRGSCELVPGCATSRDDKAAVPRAQCTSVVSRWWLRGRGGRARVYMRSLRAPNNGFCRIPYQVRVHHVFAGSRERKAWPLKVHPICTRPLFDECLDRSSVCCLVRCRACARRQPPSFVAGVGRHADVPVHWSSQA